jgi:hypothetical protein
LSRRWSGPVVGIDYAALVETLLEAASFGIERAATRARSRPRAASGMRATSACLARTHEWLPVGSERLACSWHHASDEGLLVVWPPEYRQWALQHGLLQDSGGRRQAAGKHQPSTRSVSSDASATGPASARHGRPSAAALEVVNPPGGAIYSIDPTLRSEFQSLALRAVAASPGEIEWQVDGNLLGAASSDQACMWLLSPGRHAITARDEHGRTAQTTIVVR